MLKKRIIPIYVIMLLFIGLFSPMFMFSPISSADDFSDCTYYKELTLTENIVNYSINFIVNKTTGDINCSGHCQDDFDDLRFVDSEDNEMHYWIEECSSGDYANVWLNISDETTIKMYYGDDEATEGSDINGTFLWGFDGSWDITEDVAFNDYYERDADSRYQIWIWNLSEPALKVQTYSYFYFTSIDSVNWAGGFEQIISNDEDYEIGSGGGSPNYVMNDDYLSIYHTLNNDDNGDDDSPGIKVRSENDDTGVSSTDWNCVDETEGDYYYEKTYYTGSKYYFEQYDSSKNLENTRDEGTNDPDEDFTVFAWYLCGETKCDETGNQFTYDAVNHNMRSYKKGYHSGCSADHIDYDYYFYFVSKWNETAPSISSVGAEAESESSHFVSGYPYAEQSFRINDFVEVDDLNFTLGGEVYKILGADSYYLVDYACNKTYDDDGHEITNSRQYVLEILNEANYLNINVIRTWGGMQGGNDSHWKHNKTGGHWNLFEIGEPGNWSETTYEALDWLVNESKTRDIRLMLTFVNNWDDYGGMRWYVQESPTTDKTYQWVNDTSDDNWSIFHDQFYTDENCKNYYKNATAYLLNRTNTFTGVKYKDEPTIFAWLLGNEPRYKNGTDSKNHSVIEDWATEMVTYIKTIDTNHTVGLGIEGWGLNETWGEGTDMISAHNNTGVDFCTFALHPDSWKYFAERSEDTGDGDWMTDGLETDDYIDWWTNTSGITYNNRYTGGNLPEYIPDEGRHGYDDWVRQNVNWSNEMGMPVILQEVGYQTSHGESAKERFYQQAIHNFFDCGGDGLMFWTLNHDNYYYSTDTPGDMDDGYGFYVSNNETLKDKSQAVIDAFDFARTDNGGDSWVTYLNDKTYNFVVNVTYDPGTFINLTLFLNITNATASRDVTIVNTSVESGVQWTYTYEFENDDRYVNWTAQLNTDDFTENSSNISTQLATLFPTVSTVSPANDYITNLTTVTFNYTITTSLDIVNSVLYIDGEEDQINTTIDTDEAYQEFITTLTPGTHTWYIKTTDIEDTYGLSGSRDLLIDVPPDAPTLVRPTGIPCLPPSLGVTVTDQNGGTLNVTFFNNATGAIIGTDNDVINNTEALVYWTGLDYNTTYEWYVIVNDTLSNTTSDVFNFTTNARPDLTLLSPTNGRSNTNNEITLNWTGSDFNGDDVTYTIYFGTNAGSLNEVVNETSEETYDLTGLYFGTTYYWRVIAEDECGATNTSAIYSFNTRAATATEAITSIAWAFVQFVFVFALAGIAFVGIQKIINMK